MTQEEKDLLLKDLCARTPYKPKINVDDIGLFTPRLKYIDGITCHFYECAWTKFIDEIKPYLRPMTSITEKERNELSHYDNSVQRTDFFYSHHIDCRFMIEKGLALEAPEGMYNI